MSQKNEHTGPAISRKSAGGRFYENSPAAGRLRKENDKAAMGGCFNNYSSWTPQRNDSLYSGFRATPNYAPYKGYSQNSYTPNRSGNEYNAVRLRLVDLNISDSTSSADRSFKSTLPAWALDELGGVLSSVTLEDVLAHNAVIDFATDKNGCRFLQEQYPVESDGGGVHDRIFRKMVEDRAVFLAMCRNMFGNFFVQRMVECSNLEEQEIVMEHLVTDMFNLCLDKSACRVIQLAIQKLDTYLATRLAAQLRDINLVLLSIDQNGNHVIQKIIKTLPIDAWDFAVEFYSNDSNLIAVCQDKYGCRVIQSTIEKLSDDPELECYGHRINLLEKLMGGVIRNCSQLASNEFANYVVQHVVKSDGAMEKFKNTIIEKCLLRNLLSMSQEKYASHVVEVAFRHAPHRLVFEMMEEIFEGYVPHPETNRDALDILLFHQYGNYVIQQMINICCVVVLGQSEAPLELREIEQYGKWLDRIKDRVSRNASRLERFSSGKKIIEALQKTENSFSSLPLGYFH